MNDPSTPGRQSERPEPESDSTYDSELPRRLVVCLDGTWNKRDSGTNVYHIANLVEEGRVKEKDKDGKTVREWFQIIYYDEGVGTGLLDSVSGGGFGIGLSENIRQAYDWLVEKYREGNEQRPSDEIYIFGFSRGAFTARSLVGLIAKCGLVCRGAPISPEELWGAYPLPPLPPDPPSGRKPAKQWWKRLAGVPRVPFHPLRDLKLDPWETGPPRSVKTPQNLAEQLLITWSRRVRIRCVGIYDTVGAIGVDMLAIPRLREKTARFHDTQLSSMVQNGFHALAIDEHRANFVHIPWRCAINGNWPDDGKIEQRWFVGAHSNIGGGYDDDVLAQFPLAWMLKECSALGLMLRPPETIQADPLATPATALCLPLLLPEKGKHDLSEKPPRVRDSFAEIAHGIWKNVVRSKPEYRRIGPPLEVDNGQPSQSVNEFVDKSAWDLLAADQTSPKPYNPPNLWAYRQNPNPPDAAVAGRLNYDPPRHHYLHGIGACVWLIVWLGLIGVAAQALGQLLHDRWHILAFGVPVLACLADWRESVLNHAVALEPDGVRAERRLAAIDFYLFWRLVFICFVLAGVILVAVNVAPWLVRIGPTSWLWWLIGLDVLMIHFGISAAWSAAPMADAGFGSIVKLQRTKTPALVMELFGHWTGGDFGPKGRQLLAPVVRTLWRDILGFIPSYSVLLFLGTWMALSLFSPEKDRLCLVLSTHRWTWGVAGLLAAACAIADWIEDRHHLNYIKGLPNPPGAGTVVRALWATRLKIGLFILGFVATSVATACFLWREVTLIFHREAGGIALAVVFFTVALFYSRVRNWASKA
jgi:uncharacterized protein (DUF2235 family)